MRELGIDTLTFKCLGNLTYKLGDKNEKQIITEHVETLKNNFNLSCNVKDRVIPRIFWNAKKS